MLLYTLNKLQLLKTVIIHILLSGTFLDIGTGVDLSVLFSLNQI